RVEVTRVGLEVLPGAELEGVDEVGEDHMVGDLPARSTRDRWPSWRAPMVITTATVPSSAARWRRRDCLVLTSVVVRFIAPPSAWARPAAHGSAAGCRGAGPLCSGPLGPGPGRWWRCPRCGPALRSHPGRPAPP